MAVAGPVSNAYMLRRQPLDPPAAAARANSAAGRADGWAGPARIRSNPGEAGSHPSSAAPGCSSHRTWPPASRTRASRNSRSATGELCQDAQALNCAPRGRVLKYASDSARDVFAIRSRDAHLPVQIRPVEDQRGARILRQLAPFSAPVVGEEDEPVGGGLSQQNHAGGRLALGRDGCQRHRIGFLDSGRAGFGEPLVELRDRIGIQIRSRGARPGCSARAGRRASAPRSGRRGTTM